MPCGAFAFFDGLAEFFAENGHDKKRPSAAARYEVLAAFVEGLGLPEEKMRIFREYLRFDRLLHFHRSRGMLKEDVFDFGQGPVRIRFDYSVEDPVSSEAGHSIG